MPQPRIELGQKFQYAFGKIRRPIRRPFCVFSRLPRLPQNKKRLGPNYGPNQLKFRIFPWQNQQTLPGLLCITNKNRFLMGTISKFPIFFRNIFHLILVNSETLPQTQKVNEKFT